jgi:hypothetical protein
VGGHVAYACGVRGAHTALSLTHTQALSHTRCTHAFACSQGMPSHPPSSSCCRSLPDAPLLQFVRAEGAIIQRRNSHAVGWREGSCSFGRHIRPKPPTLLLHTMLYQRTCYANISSRDPSPLPPSLALSLRVCVCTHTHAHARTRTRTRTRKRTRTRTHIVLTPSLLPCLHRIIGRVSSWRHLPCCCSSRK